MKGYSQHMREAVRNIIAKGLRDRMVLAMFTYAHQPFLTEHFFMKGLKSAGLDYADILILGFFPRRPSKRIIDRTSATGGCSCIALSQAKQRLKTHSRRKFCPP